MSVPLIIASCVWLLSLGAAGGWLAALLHEDTGAEERETEEQRFLRIPCKSKGGQRLQKLVAEGHTIRDAVRIDRERLAARARVFIEGGATYTDACVRALEEDQ